MKNNPTCETCARRASCDKPIGIIYGFCNIDYVPTIPATDPAPMDFNDPWVAFFEPD